MIVFSPLYYAVAELELKGRQGMRKRKRGFFFKYANYKCIKYINFLMTLVT